MKIKLENQKFNTCLETSDWRYSAAINGLVEYFQYYEKDNVEYEIKNDCLFYNEEDINEERYLEFAEDFYKDDMHHKIIENMLQKEEFSDADIKDINDKLKANTILKKVFGKVKFDGKNSDEILNIILKNKSVLIKETFKNKNNLYANYCNTNSLFSNEGQCCRLIGYYIDTGKKGKSISYNFNKNNYIYEDDIVFDFIPFSFNGKREKFFINDNITIDNLIKSNNTYKSLVENSDIKDGMSDSKKILFNNIIELDDFINSDIVVVSKKQENDLFETLYIREESIECLKKIKSFYKVFNTVKKITDDYWINVYDEVIDCILNEVRVDKLIEMFLKENERSYVVSKLIDVNIIIENGGEVMEKRTKAAYASAKAVVEKIPENKLTSYRQKLTSAIVFRDYDRFCDILLQLSNYSDVSFDFAYDLFEDFESNKDVAYSFVNSLIKKENDGGKE